MCQSACSCDDRRPARTKRESWDPEPTTVADAAGAGSIASGAIAALSAASASARACSTGRPRGRYVVYPADEPWDEPVHGLAVSGLARIEAAEAVSPAVVRILLEGAEGSILGGQIRIGRPLGIKGLPEAARGPAFSTAVGLLVYPQVAPSSVDHERSGRRRCDEAEPVGEHGEEAARSRASSA